MKFKKSIKIFPGFRLNLSKSGIGASVGGKGLSLSVGKHGAFLNTSIPGTGMYERTKIGGGDPNKDLNAQDVIVKKEDLDEIKSANIESIVSSKLSELNDTINEAFNNQNEMIKELSNLNDELAKLNSKGLFGFKSGTTKDRIKEIENELIELRNNLSNSKVAIDIELDEVMSDKYKKIRESFINLSKCQFIWDITSSKQTDKNKSRSGADKTVRREKVEVKFDTVPIISCKENAMYFENANGEGELYFYPLFVAFIDIINSKVAILEYGDIEVNFIVAQTIEQETVPIDAKVTGKTWAKVNKDGSPDKRFEGNYEIPKVEYGMIEFKSKGGLNETYLFSNSEVAKTFVESINSFR